MSNLKDLNLSLSTLAIHADEHLAPCTDIAPPLHVSTNFRYPSDPSLLGGPMPHIYSRDSAPSTSRLETTLASLLGGETVVYSSGLAAFHALLVNAHPKRLLITEGYHGCHGTAALFSKLTGMAILPLSTPPQEGDLVHIETPINPTGIATNIEEYAERAHAAGALVSVDATFAPPPLQDPFAHAADYVMHSGSKYFGGHSDMLAGTLSVRSKELADKLRGERLYLGATMGNMEAWLGLRSLKTLELRVTRQSASASVLAGWIKAQLAVEGSVVQQTVKEVTHASLQDGGEWLQRQMPGGFGPVFSLVLKSEEMAKTLPSKLLLWGHATSLGCVESLIEWRGMTDTGCDKRLLRLSIGVEDVGDLRRDLERGFEGVVGL
ncbi:cystathionine gamma-synthase [Wilcoxina mikolae CBS 423.85]|nr:cystathionine gamma-synthase [Wilcoxina mikolae CBS 423.85]